MKEQSREICYITMVMMELMVKVFQIFLIGHDSGFVAVKMVMMTSIRRREVSGSFKRFVSQT